MNAFVFRHCVRTAWTAVRPLVVCIGFLGLGPLLFAVPTDLELAYASRIAYSGRLEHITEWNRDPARFLAGYKLMDLMEDTEVPGQKLVGFRAIALRNDATRTVIIAYRGTEPSLAANVAVDAGMFLTIAGKRPHKVIAGQLGQLGRHYQGDEGAAMVAAAAMLDAIPPSDDGGTWLHPALKVGLFAMGLPFSVDGDLRTLTKTSCDHAIAFFKKTRGELLKEAGDPEGWRITKALIKSGWKADPRESSPNGYAIYLTGHSLGGFLAQVVGATQGANTVTFAAPGAQEYLAASGLGTKDLKPFTVRQIFRANDLVGSFGTHVGQSVPLCNFYDSPVERERLQAAVDASERDCAPKRAAWLVKEQETFRIRLAAYEGEKVAYAPLLAAYQASVEKLEAERAKMGWMEWGRSTLAGGPTKPAEPKRPVEPTAQMAWNAFPNPYLAKGPSLKDWAKVHYGGVVGYFYTNHSLEGIIHQFEREGGLALTEPYPHAPAVLEEAKETANPVPAVRILAASQEVAPGGELSVSALRTSGRDPGWTWTATAGTLVNLGDGNARFTAPSDAADGTVITITAEEASSSSSSAPLRASLEVRIRR